MPVLSQPHDGWTGQSGYVQVDLCSCASVGCKLILSRLTLNCPNNAFYGYIFRLLFPEPSKFITLFLQVLFYVGRSR